MDIAFIKIINPESGAAYTSYLDFYRLVELGGFRIVSLAEIAPQSQTIYIIPLNYGIPDSIFDLPRSNKIILWQSERYNLIDCRYDEIWYYDRTVLDFATCDKAKYVFLGGDKRLVQPTSAIKKYDFYHMAHISGRRQEMVNELIDRGHSIAPAPIDYRTKNEVMQQSRVGLCLHQDEYHYIEPFRYAVFASYRLPLLCEPVCGTPYLTYSYQEFIRHHQSIDYPRNWQDNYDLVTNRMPFRKSVLGALNDFDFTKI